MPVSTRVAIDPMSKFFSDLLEAHPELWEKIHPHVPKEEIAQAARAMTTAQRRAYLGMARAMIDYATPWVEVLKET